MAFSGAFVKPFRPAFDAGLAAAAVPNGLLNNLVAYWPLNEAGGANNALDLHTNGLTLAQVASPGSAAGKVYAGARTFNGSTQYFNRASEALLQTGDVDFTIASWVYLTGAAGVVFGKDAGGASREYYLYADTTLTQFVIYKATATAMLINAAGISQNAWNLIFAWHDMTLDTVNVQINGGSVASAATTGVPISTSARFDIGDRENTSSRSYWPGRIGPVAMWKSAAGAGGVLTAAQRLALYNSGAGLAYSAFS